MKAERRRSRLGDVSVCPPGRAGDDENAPYLLRLRFAATCVLAFATLSCAAEDAGHLPDAWVDAGVAFSQADSSQGWDRRLGGQFTGALIRFREQYLLYYGGSSGYDTTCNSVAYRQIGVASSPDGLTWTRYEGNPIVEWTTQGGSVEEGATAGTAWVGSDDRVYMYYAANSGAGCSINADVRLAVSDDGFDFVDLGKVLDHQDRNVWKSGDELFPVAAYETPARTWVMYYIPNGVLAGRHLGMAWGSSPGELSETSGVNGGSLGAWGSASITVDEAGRHVLWTNDVRESSLRAWKVAPDRRSAIALRRYSFPRGDYRTGVVYREEGRWLLLHRDVENSEWRVKTAEIRAEDRDLASPGKAP